MSGDVTRLLRAASGGDPNAVPALFELVYDELRARARAQLAGSAPQTLSATGLVHEAYLKLTAGGIPELNDRTHFFRVAARAMRHIAIDRARARRAERRGGHAQIIDIELAEIPVDDAAGPLLALDAALDELAKRSPRLAELVELRFFAGLSVDDAASVMNTSARTVKRDWQVARAFIHAQLDDTRDDNS
ncbi:MAG: ECF-type sigma factor [Steroidobacteraceae bacterium]